jgi:hypothetical protein
MWSSVSCVGGVGCWACVVAGCAGAEIHIAVANRARGHYAWGPQGTAPEAGRVGLECQRGGDVVAPGAHIKFLIDY